ncbi:FtsK/SpoIIIE domain-containing protein [Sanguibacter suaedae]|uniref:FtsK domain-containing protein n=1 Tax=Sanguibacter suaedae TaxID=2795737 RepID=A0A934I9N4_9MICO|nr:FtsK/SpoIIIE domain-containing protein [Sanguibacter suaedae]MBI9114740.1 hypothetical protein [Sanguibacter suaedae]
MHPTPSPSTADGTVRVTVHPGQDVLVPRGLPLSDLRPALAACTGRAELLDSALHVTDRRLDEHHVVGHPPLVAGATLRTSPSRPSATERALEGSVHVAVLAGPGCGRLRRPDEPDLLDGTGLSVRLRSTRRHPVVVEVRADGPTRATPGAHHVRSRAGRRSRPVRRSWRRWHPGDRIHVTGPAPRTFQLRDAPTLEDVTLDALLEPPESASGSDRAAGHGITGPTIAAAAVPAIGSVVLAVALGNPLFILLAVVGPLAVLGPALLRGRAARSAPPDDAGAATDGLHPADLATAVAASALTAPRDRPVGPPVRPVERSRLPAGPAGSCVAVVGDRPDVLAVVGRLVTHLHATDAGPVTVVHEPDRAPDWEWARWLPGCTGQAPPAPLPVPPGTAVVVVDATEDPELHARLGAWCAAHPGSTVLLVAAGDHVPSWCTTRADVAQGSVRWSAPGRRPRTGPLEAPDAAWLEEYARSVAGLADRGRWPAVTARAGDRRDGSPPLEEDLPGSVALIDVLGAATTPRGIAARWQHAPSSSLVVPLGTGPGGAPVTVDLLRDGPHALVAGTTGAGKSELLQTLVLGLALTYPPDALAVALVDYKGGASLGACARLPHVVGQVTDLDPGVAGRALAGLRAELRRRERAFAAVGARDLGSYRDLAGPDDEPFPRLLVVVDEFRAMADDHPDFIPGLVRIAAQGRSLGIHLVLATQRPSGAITADMRANISLRIALRVVDDADSTDVIDHPGAARISATHPGRALLRRGLDEPEAVQTFYAAGAPSERGASITPAPAWGRVPSAPSRAAWSSFGEPERAARAPVDQVGLLVAAARSAATARGTGTPRVPWTPALPTRVAWDSLPGVTGAAGLPVALVDQPDAQQHGTWSWDVRAGHLLVLGRAGTGRTSTLRTVARAAALRGTTVHVVGRDDLGLAPGTAGTGTWVDRSDPRRLARLLQVLLAETPAPSGARAGVTDEGTPRHLVVVDGLEDALTALGMVRRGAGVDLLVSVLREGPARGVLVAVSAANPPASSVSSLVGVRLHLAGRDRADDTFLGIPAAFAGKGGAPGRGVVLTEHGPAHCQVALPPDPPRSDAPVEEPTRLLPLPRTVRLDVEPENEESRRRTVTLGAGGDHGLPVGLPAGSHMLVCGPPGSGRSSALQVVADHARRYGHLLGVASRESAVAVPGVPALESYGPAAAAEFLEGILQAARQAGGTRPTTVVLDDLDALGLAAPAAVDALHATLGQLPTLRVVASSATGTAAGAFRGLVAELRNRRRGLVLDPAAQGSAEVFGVDLAWHVDPQVRVPGRGVLVEGSTIVPLQVAIPRRSVLVEG